MMFHAKCAAITVLVNIMVYLHATDVLAFLNVQYADHETMCAKLKRKANALLTKHIAINVVRVA